MDSDEPGVAELLCKVGDRAVDAIRLAIGSGVGQTVLGEKMGNAGKVEKACAIADLDRNAVQLLDVRLPQSAREFLEHRAKIRAIEPFRPGAAKLFEFVQRPFEVFGLHGLEEVVDRVYLECL